MILPLGNLPAAKANRKELLINQIPIKGDAWKNIYIYAHINPTRICISSAKCRNFCCCSIQRDEEGGNSLLGCSSNTKTCKQLRC